MANAVKKLTNDKMFVPKQVETIKVSNICKQHDYSQEWSTCTLELC